MRRCVLVFIVAVPLWCAGSAHAATCREGIRPDLACTPGATNPQVSQATIAKTICVRGYTKTIRPPVSVASQIKTERMRAYGVGSQPPGNFELDHLISLELGGAPSDVKNLWPEPYAGSLGAKVKDKTENLLHARVCSGQISLRAAQRQIVKDWTAIR